MYVPKHFQQDDRETLFDTIATHSFGLLVLQSPSGPQAAHLPFVLYRDIGPQGCLRCHVARANPIWRNVETEPNALAVFLGPHTYISPDWYESAHQVPTWNYAAVHVTGASRLLEDDELMRLLEALIEKHETPLPKLPWTTDKLPPLLYAKLRKAIVGIEIPIDTVQGKWKLSQNKTRSDRTRAAAALAESESENSQTVSDLMCAAAQDPTETP